MTSDPAQQQQQPQAEQQPQEQPSGAEPNNNGVAAPETVAQAPAPAPAQAEAAGEPAAAAAPEPAEGAPAEAPAGGEAAAPAPEVVEPKATGGPDNGHSGEPQSLPTPPPTPEKKAADEPSKCNLTLVLHEKLRMGLEQRPLPPKPAPHEVTLATHTVGICGSDVKYWQQGKIGNFILTKPMILGHETSATVIEVGDKVKYLRPGDKVAVEVGLPCGRCKWCRCGKYNLCVEMAFAATPPVDGTLTRYFNHPADFCFKLPESVSLEEGALLEPLAVAVQACKKATIKLGDIVLVCGAGPIGIMAMMAARAYGASHVLITDIMEARLEFARKMGATMTFKVERDQAPAQLAAQIRQYVSSVRPTNVGVDKVLECSGAESSIHLAIYSASVGAQIVCVGCQPDLVSIPLNNACMQEIDIKGVFRYSNCYPVALNMVESGKIDMKPLISHRFTLEESVKAFEMCHSGQGIKILINCVDEKASNGAPSA